MSDEQELLIEEDRRRRSARVLFHLRRVVELREHEARTLKTAIAVIEDLSTPIVRTVTLRVRHGQSGRADVAPNRVSLRVRPGKSRVAKKRRKAPKK